MAVVVVTNSNNSREDFEGTPSFTSIGGGAGAGKELVTFLEGAASGSRKVTGSASTGFWVNAAAGVDMTQANDDRVWMCKILLYDYADLNSTGLRVRIGSDTSNYIEYLLADDGTRGDADHPVLGGWLIMPIDPNEVAFRDFTTGTPSLTAVDQFAVTAALATGAAKSENLFIDAVDLGDGLYLVGGDGADADGVFQDFVGHDQGAAANRFGHAMGGSSELGAIFVRGKLIIGRNSSQTVTATEFTDLGAVLFFPETRTPAGWPELELDVGNASTVISLTSCSFTGLGAPKTVVYFDTNDGSAALVGDVFPTADQISELEYPGVPDLDLKTGDFVIYSKEGGSDSFGLSEGTNYWVDHIVGVTIELHTSRNNAYTAATPVDLTNAGTGEEHSLTRSPDRQPTLTVTGTAGSVSATGCFFQGFRKLTLTSAVTFTACTLFQCRELVLSTATLDGCIIRSHISTRGEAFITAPTLANITNCDFTAAELDSSGRHLGHAIEITTAGTYAFSGNTFTGYGPNRAQFSTDSSGIDPTGEVITTDAAHGLATGELVYYNKEGGTASVGLTEGTRYYVNVLTTTTLSLHRTRQAADEDARRVNLSTSGAETHSLYSGRAAILNSSGGSVTINVTGAANPTVRNTPGSSTTVAQTVTLTVTVKDRTDEANIQFARVVIRATSGGPETVGTVLLSAETNASGVASDTYNFSSNQPIEILVRRASPQLGQKYEGSRTTDTITGTFSTQVLLTRDQNVE